MSVFTNPAGGTAEAGRAYVAAVLGLLGERAALDVLEGTEAALIERVRRVPAARLIRPEAPGKWSVRDVVQHLADSELVWGYRLRMVLAHERPVLTGYDQDAFARQLHYHEANAEQALQEFSVLRHANLRLLTRASDEELRRIGVHEERGEESVAYMMRLYAGHDLLHLRQIDRILRND